ncbi:MAG TPA: phospholipid carrier-dependent glycosyltransferase [Thermoanaerobaculia bacterium]|nr:phospholipid carrier-dependent glycosyltransferase [Thermoanaerobaculia bacterium]
MTGRRPLLFLLAAVTVLLFVEFPGSWLLEPDEARYAEIPREMLATGNWLVPRLNGVDYFEKPPLTYWANAVSIAALGHNPFAARLPERLAILGTALLLAGALRKPFGERVAILSALIFLSSPLVFALGRTALTDGVLTFTMAITLMALHRFLLASEEGRAAPGAAALAGLGCGLSLLDKGLIGVVLPGGAFVLWCVLRRTARPIVRILLSWAPVVCLAVAAPYFIAVELAAPGFSKFFWIHEHFVRYATPEASRPGPPWYFLLTFLLGMLPWTFFSSRLGRRLWWSKRRATAPDASDLWFALWFSVILVFFSLSHSKLTPYVLPACPAAAVLFARLIDAHVETGEKTPARPLAFHAAFWTVAAPAGFFLLARSGDLARYGLAAPAAAALGVLVAASWIGAFAARRRPLAGIGTAVAGWCIFYAALIAAFPRIAADQSAHDLAVAAGRAAGDSAEVVCYRTYLQGFPLELERRVRIFGWKGELAYGSARGDSSAWFPPREAFWTEWDSPKKMVVLLRKRDRPEMYGHRAELVAQNRKYFVVKNFR